MSIWCSASLRASRNSGPCWSGHNRGNDAARLPDTGHKTVPHRTRIPRPPRMMGQNALFTPDSVDDRDPSRYDQRQSAEIAFLKVIANIAKDVGNVHRVAYEPVRSAD